MFAATLAVSRPLAAQDPVRGGARDTVPPAAVDTTGAGADAVSPDCRDAATQRQIERCLAVALERADSTMTTAFLELRTALGPERRVALESVQAAWEAFREAQCGYEASEAGGGTMRPSLLLQCRIWMARERTVWLREEMEAALPPPGPRDGQ